jgi:hypothetical protein
MAATWSGRHCGAAHGVHNTCKFRQEPVAGVLYDPTPVLGDLGIDQLTEMSFEPLVRALLIRPHQARVGSMEWFEAQKEG